MSAAPRKPPPTWCWKPPSEADRRRGCARQAPVAASGLHPHRADVIHLSDRHAVMAQDGVGRGGVEIEVGHAETGQEVLRLERPARIAKFEAHVRSRQRIHRGAVQPFKVGNGFGNPFAQPVESLGMGREVWRENALESPFKRALRMHGTGAHLTVEGEHIRREACCHQFGFCRAIALAELLRLGQPAVRPAQRLQIGRNNSVVE